MSVYNQLRPWVAAWRERRRTRRAEQLEDLDDAALHAWLLAREMWRMTLLAVFVFAAGVALLVVAVATA